MATHSSVLAWGIPGTGAWWASVCGVAQSRTQLKRLSNIYIYMWLYQVLVAAHEIFSCSMWDLVSWPEIEPRPPALGALSLSHWTTGEVLAASACASVSPLSHLNKIVVRWKQLIHVKYLEQCPACSKCSISFKKYFYWSRVDLQCGVTFRCTAV